VIQLLSTIYAYAYPEDSTDTPQPQFKILKNASYILGTPWDTGYALETGIILFSCTFTRVSDGELG